MSAALTRRLILAGLPALTVAPAFADDAPARVLALGGAVTETVFALGAGAELVGVDLTSSFPAAAARVPRVGYVRALGAEGMLSLNPQLVLAAAEAGPPPALARVAEAGVPVVRLAAVRTPDAALARIGAVGAALRRPAQAATVTAALRADLDQVQAGLAHTPGRPRVLFLLSAGRGAPMGAGRDTEADAMIALAGGVNAMHDIAQYRPLSAEAVLQAEPEIIVTTTGTLAAAGGIAGLRGLPGLTETPAVQAGRVHDFDALYLLGFGPRLAHALRDLALVLHPGLDLPALPARSWTTA